jgi:hypothetical protein
MSPKVGPWELGVDAVIVLGQTEICDVGYGLTRIDACT